MLENIARSAVIANIIAALSNGGSLDHRPTHSHLHTFIRPTSRLDCTARLQITLHGMSNCAGNLEIVLLSSLISSSYYYRYEYRYLCQRYVDLGVTWVCVRDLTWHQNDLKVD